MKNSTKNVAAKNEERPFSFVSSDEKHIVIAFNVDGDKFEKRFDIRYVPTGNAAEFEVFCNDYIEAYKKGAQSEAAAAFVDPEILKKL